MADMQETPPAPDMVQCEITGKWVPEDEVVEIQGKRVSAEGKQILLERLQAGETLPGEVEPPSALRRIGSAILDNILLWVVGMVIGFALGFGLATMAAGSPAQAALLQGFAALLGGVINVVYFGTLHGARGQSVGKIAGKCKVVDAAGAPISVQRAFLRALYYPGPYLIPAVVILVSFGMEEMMIAGMVLNGAVFLYVLVDLIVALADRQGQRSLHDRFAGTRVISTEG